jgi:hypothetical protein
MTYVVAGILVLGLIDVHVFVLVLHMLRCSTKHYHWKYVVLCKLERPAGGL